MAGLQAWAIEGHDGIGRPVARSHVLEVLALHAGLELQYGGMQFPGQEVIDFPPPAYTHRGNGAEGIEGNPMLVQASGRRPHFGIGWGTATHPAEGVMDVLRAINAQSHHKLMLCQECTPSVIQQHAVGLEGIGKGNARPGMFLLKGDHLAVKVQANQRRLPALPGEKDRGIILRLDVLGNKLLQQFLGYGRVVFALWFRLGGVAILMMAVVAVFAG